MIKRSILGVLLLALAFSTSACYIAKVETPGIRNIVSTSPVRGTKVGTVDKTYHQWYVLWGLVPIGTPNVRADLEKELATAGGRSVANLKVETGNKMPMMLLNLLTGFFSVANQQIQVQGDILK